MPRTTRVVRAIRSVKDLEVLEQNAYDELVPSRTIYQLFQATSQLHGQRPALSMLGSAAPNDVPAVYSHRTLLAEITRAANMFAECGIRDGGVVSILSRTHARIPSLIWGAETAGTVSCINYLLSPQVIAALLDAERARILVCSGPDLDSELWAKACEVMTLAKGLHTVLVLGGAAGAGDAHMRDLDELMDRQPGDRLTFTDEPDRNRVAALFHTGGTTGVPKLVPQTHLNQIHAAWSLAQHFHITEEDIALNGFPLFHVGGTSTIGLSVLGAGGHVVMLSPAGLRDPKVVGNIWKYVERYRATIVGGVPTSIGAMSEVPVGDSDLSSLRFALTGGAPLPTVVAQRFEQRTGIPLLEQYGMTESVAAIAATPFKGKHIRGSVGIRGPFSRIAIMKRGDDGTWVSCPPGTIGSVVSSGPQMMKGYLDPEHNKKAFTPEGGLITGDLGYLDDHGYLFLTGREKDLIIRSGHNIDPLAIEEVANAHPAVAVSAAVSMPDGYAGELPVVFVAPAAGQSIDVAELQKFISDRISEPPAKPRHVFVLEAIPVTGVGKIFKPALRELALIYKLRMEVAALDAPVEVVEISAGPGGSSASIRLRMVNYADQTRCADAFSAAIANLPVKVHVEWSGN